MTHYFLLMLGSLVVVPMLKVKAGLTMDDVLAHRSTDDTPPSRHRPYYQTEKMSSAFRI